MISELTAKSSQIKPKNLKISKNLKSTKKPMDLEKYDSITKKMNRITEEITKNIELSDELLVASNDIKDVFESIDTQTLITIEQDSDENPIQQAIDLDLMKEDFEYMRNNLKKSTENTKRVLESVTEELLLAEGESRSGLVLAFSELNKAQLEGMKLYMQSYKEISSILVNLAKFQKDTQPKVTTTNVVNVETKSEGLSTAEIVKRLKQE